MFQAAVLLAVWKKYGTERLKAIGRTSAYAGALVTTLGLVTAHKAHASLEATGLRVSSDLAAVAPLLQDGTSLDVNGQRFHFAATRTDEGMTTVLDHFQSSCEQSAGGDVPIWNSIPSTAKEAQKLGKLDKMPILRSEDGNHGFILCMIPTAAMTRSGFLASLKNFMQHGDKLDVGKLRYATVQGDAQGTRVVTFWTDESFDVSKLLPDPKHDKPGSDPGVMMRPQNATRMLSATAEGVPYKVFLYQTNESTGAALKSYDEQMFANGWVSISVPQMNIIPHEGFEAHAYMRNGFIGYFTTTKGPTGATIVSIGETAKVDAKEDLKLSPMRDTDGF